MRRRVSAVAEELAAAVPPASGAVVMGTGIVSIGLSLDRQETLSRILVGIAAAVWIVLGLQLLALASRRRRLLLEQARLPAALTGIAGTNVLGTRLLLLGWNWQAAALLAVGLALWLALVPNVLAHWRRPTVGASFVLTVATESLAVLGAALAIEEGAPWLAVAALVCVGLGLLGYVFVVASFDLRQLLVGRGDHWVSGGALAIATLACARSAQAAGLLAPLRSVAGSLDTAALALWAAAAAWLPALLLGELLSRRGGYDVRRWSTVFPLGMYAVCSLVVGDVQRIGGLERFARIWIWVAFTVWLLVFAGMLRRSAEVVCVSLFARSPS
jgi:tellurite resistance protein TehA-like permease